MNSADQKYLQLLGEIDYLYFELNRMYQSEKKLSAIERQIDDATGYSEAKLKEAKSIMRKINYRKRKLRALGDNKYVQSNKQIVELGVNNRCKYTRSSYKDK